MNTINTEGMERAANHAERVEHGWMSAALSFLTSYAAVNRSFLAEDVVKAAAEVIPLPPDRRAWGAVFNTASRRRLIVNIGFGRAESSNGSHKPIWAAAAH